MSELSSWLERPVEEDWEDVGDILRCYGVYHQIDILQDAWQRKAERYSSVFPTGKTRITKDVPQLIHMPSSRITLLYTFRQAALDLGIASWRLYDKICQLADPYTNDEIVHNRTRDGQKLLRLILKDVPESERTEIELVWSRAIRSFRRSDSTLVWSISPLDILLQSMAGITSCHNLEDGCHRGGAVAYMTDTATSIIYTANTLRSFADLNGLRVPEKSWRSLCFYQPDEGIRVQREYPHEVRDYLCEADKLILERTQDWTLKGVFPQVVYKSDAPYKDPAVLGHSMSNSSTIRGIANGVCPECGQLMDSKENLFCSLCGPSAYCDWCHEPIRSHETSHTVGCSTYCDDCYEHLFVECYHCGDAVREERAEHIHGHTYCRACASELFTVCWECGADVPREDVIEVYGRPYCPNCIIECAECGREVPAGETYRWHHNPYERFCRECLEKLADAHQRQLAH